MSASSSSPLGFVLDPSDVLQDVEELAEAGPPEAPPEPWGPVRTQARPDSMVKTHSADQPSNPASGAQQRCLIS